MWRIKDYKGHSLNVSFLYLHSTAVLQFYSRLFSPAAARVKHFGDQSVQPVHFITKFLFER